MGESSYPINVTIPVGRKNIFELRLKKPVRSDEWHIIASLFRLIQPGVTCHKRRRKTNPGQLAV